MDALLGTLTNLFNLFLVVVGFGMVVFIHEMGHFLTARWAGIRVFAFALGFGPAIVSYRKGLGWRRGSSEEEYISRLKAEAAGVATIEGTHTTHHNISPTEYRLNALPFGGYVKMLGQSDLNPEATATAPDSYLAKPIWKRMIVISGGVVMNLVLALTIFMFVFFVGIETEPAKVGMALPESPAALAVAANAKELGVEQAGLRPGDSVLEVNGRTPDDFNDVIMAAAMTGPDEQVRVVIERPGIAERLHFAITPERNQFTNLFDLGIEPPRTLTIPAAYAARPADWDAFAARFGMGSIEPGMTLSAVDGDTGVLSVGDFVGLVRASGGSPMDLTFVAEDGREVKVAMTPSAELMRDDANPDPEVLSPITHLLGLTPVMTVGPITPESRGYEQGLREGDVFVRLGAVEYPGINAGIREVQRNSGKAIEIVVLREDETGETSEVAFTAEVTSEGTIGFATGDTASTSSLVALSPRGLRRVQPGSTEYRPVLAAAISRPGTRILAINDLPVSNFNDLREALRAATLDAYASGEGPAEITMAIAPPLPPQPDGIVAEYTVKAEIPRDQLDRLHALSWEIPFGTWFFQPEPFVLRATGPIDAIRMGVNRTQRMMTMTYLTLARLVQGTVKVENLKGPVGIAHLGTQVATRGYIWLIFFLGLISVNLAVVNFLPLPIADGGQFLMLLYEQVRGRPLPITVQNAITAVGLVMLVSLFLLVTYNDVARLFGG